MATLINGDGNVAVYAAQDADWYAGIEGDVTKILPIGLKMAYEIEDANTIAVKNGVIVTKEGRRIQIDAGSIDEFIIPTGSQGIIRYFIIGYHLYTDSSSNQLCETFVQLMTSESETITENTFRGGATDVYVSLYRVKQDGLNLDTITALLPEGVSLEGISDVVDQKLGDTDISGIGDGTVTGAIDTINSDLTELEMAITTATKVAQVIGAIDGSLAKGHIPHISFNIGEPQKFTAIYSYQNIVSEGNGAILFACSTLVPSGDYMYSVMIDTTSTRILRSLAGASITDITNTCSDIVLHYHA